MDGLCSYVLQPPLQLLGRRDSWHHSHYILAHIICRSRGANSGVMGPRHWLLWKQQVPRQPQDRDEFLRIRLCDLRRSWWLSIVSSQGALGTSPSYWPLAVCSHAFALSFMALSAVDNIDITKSARITSLNQFLSATDIPRARPSIGLWHKLVNCGKKNLMISMIISGVTSRVESVHEPWDPR